MSESHISKKSNPSIPLEELFGDFSPEVKEPLEVLEDDELFAIVIGRDESTHRKNGLTGTLFLGRVCEYNSGHFGKKILVDSLSPHKIFISGKTGSGKSYTLGVLAEELAEQELGLGTIIVDPMGTFWSMRYAKEKQRGDLLDKWGLSPKKYDNIRIFVPVKLKEKYDSSTFDDVFSIRPDFLSPEDWANTFGIDYFTSPQSGLIIDVITNLKEKNKLNSNHVYSIEDILYYIENDLELQEKFQSSTIRAVKTRFESSSQWGVFSTTGTPIHTLSKPNQVSVIDVSLLNDKTRALVVGILAKQILSERTRITRQDRVSSMSRQDHEDTEGSKIPSTWLLVDEAHTLAPSRGKTAASEPLVEYAKRGRMPGCALVLATQQPSATSDEILSQIDILISHNLSFSQDILELKRRTPSKLPSDLGDDGFIRNLPVGAALISDQSTASKRTFVARIRPRISPHGGSALSVIKKEAEELIQTRPDKKEEKQVLLPIEEPDQEIRKTASINVNEVIAGIEIPEYDVPHDIAADYIDRFMRYKILYNYVNILNPMIKITSSKDNSEALATLDRYISRGYRYLETLRIDGNPVILLKKESSDVALSIIRSQGEIIIAILGPR